MEEMRFNDFREWYLLYPTLHCGVLLSKMHIGYCSVSRLMVNFRMVMLGYCLLNCYFGCVLYSTKSNLTKCKKSKRKGLRPTAPNLLSREVGRKAKKRRWSKPSARFPIRNTGRRQIPPHKERVSPTPSAQVLPILANKQQGKKKKKETDIAHSHDG